MLPFPVAPLAAAVLVQMLATVAIFTVPVLGPEIAASVGAPPEHVGVYTALAYVFAATGATLLAGSIRRWGAVRMSQACALMVAAGLAAAAGGGFAALALSAAVLGIAYALPIPTASHLLVRHTPERLHNLLFSIRQLGVPLGGMAAGALVPWLAILAGWRVGILFLTVPALVLALALQPLRARYDADRDPTRPILRGSIGGTLGLFWRRPALGRLATAGFFYAGLEVAAAIFMVTYLAAVAGASLVEGGLALAALQVGGLSGRLALGLVADHIRDRRLMLGGLGLATATFAVGLTLAAPAGLTPPLLALCFAFGFTGGGWTGVGIAESARAVPPDDVVAATGAMTFAMFSGVIVCPAVASMAVSLTGHYNLAYLLPAAGAVIGAILLLIAKAPRPIDRG